MLCFVLRFVMLCYVGNAMYVVAAEPVWLVGPVGPIGPVGLVGPVGVVGTAGPVEPVWPVGRVGVRWAH